MSPLDSRNAIRWLNGAELLLLLLLLPPLLALSRRKEIALSTISRRGAPPLIVHSSSSPCVWVRVGDVGRQSIHGHRGEIECDRQEQMWHCT